MSQIVLYFLISTSVLSFHIDVALTLYTRLRANISSLQMFPSCVESKNYSITVASIAYGLYFFSHFSYINIYLVSRRVYKIHEGRAEIRTGSTGKAKSLHANICQKLKSIKFIAIVLALFLITWVYAIVVHISRIYLGSTFPLCELETATLFALHSGTYTNPLIYAFLSRKFNHELIALWRVFKPTMWFNETCYNYHNGVTWASYGLKLAKLDCLLKSLIKLVAVKHSR